MTPSETRVVFMGSPEFAVPSLTALARAGYQLVLVVSQPDRKAGRGGKLRKPPVKAEAERLGLTLYQPASVRTDDAVGHLAAQAADIFVVAAYGRILPQPVLDLPRRGIVNVHASILPRWRGASPINSAILAGDPETGVSIMEVVMKMDAGPVISTARTPVGATETAGELEPRLAQLGANLLVETLPRWHDRELEAVRQDEARATYCSLIAKSDGHLPADVTAVEAERAVRAYNPWPGASVQYAGERLAIWAAHVVSTEGGEPGTTTVVKKKPAIALRGGLLVLDEVQRTGSRRVTGEAFLNGQRGQLEPRVGLRD